MLQSYKELKVWQKSIDLVEKVYILTKQFPKEEIYGLSIQMRRAAISISSNIAEGQRRRNLREYLQFLNIAYASSAELETQIIIARRLYPNLDYLEIAKLLEEVQKMFNVLIRRLEENLKPKTQNLKTNNGQVMVEAMLAITIAVIGLLGIFSLVSRSLSLNRVVLDRYIGTYLAAEGIEVIKNMIDANVIQANKPWNEGLAAGSYEIDYNDLTPQSDSNRFILYDPANGFYSYDSGGPTRFKRSVTIEWPSAGAGEEMKVNSVVNWTTRGGGSFDINLEDHFFNWR